ncbi:MAG: hypothetical protein OER88_03025 [Planctomycetota bacterium]|nr:hypothetical protein [Planctomycetota bacterium]
MRTIAALLFTVTAAAAEPAADPAALQQIANRIAGTIERHLGKKFEAAIPVEVISRDQLVALGKRNIERLLPPAYLEVARKFAVRMRHIPAGFDLVGTQLELLRTDAVGLYDPDADRYYLVEGAADLTTVPALITAGHELVHAYRDVDKDYWTRMVTALRHDADWSMAIQFLYEGDAQLVGSAVGLAMFHRRGLGEVLPAVAARADRDADLILRGIDAPRLKAFPRMMRHMFVGPYGHGVRLAGAVHRKGGKDALALAYDRPPRSTEQALHPEKYLSDTPDEPTIFFGGEPTAALGPGWRRLLTNVMGEFELRAHLAGVLGAQAARGAAAGWDGARYYLCEGPARASMFHLARHAPLFFGMVSTWDTEADAAQFAVSWAAWAARRDGGTPRTLERGADLLAVETRDGRVEVRILGRDVLVADGVPTGRAAPVFAALSSATRAERKLDAHPSTERRE